MLLASGVVKPKIVMKPGEVTFASGVVKIAMRPGEVTFASGVVRLLFNPLGDKIAMRPGEDASRLRRR